MEFIYEPPQEATDVAFRLLEDPKAVSENVLPVSFSYHDHDYRIEWKESLNF